MPNDDASRAPPSSKADASVAGAAALSQVGGSESAPTGPRAGAERGRAKTLPRVDAAAPELVPARMVNEVLYCPRLMYLEWSQGEFVDNAFTVEGRAVHARADRPGTPRTTEGPDDGPSVPHQTRSVWLSSARLGLTAKIDVVDHDADGSVSPIEYKRGKRPKVVEGAYLPERAQLCAQVLLLREHGYRCEQAFIYYAGEKRRLEIGIDDALIATTLAAVDRARELVTLGELPPPLVDSPKCRGCSLVGVCLPDEVTLLRALAGGSPEPEMEQLTKAAPDLVGPLDPDPWSLAGTDVLPKRVRPLLPARQERQALYVQEQGARIGLDGYCLMVRGKESQNRVGLAHISHVAVWGNVQISTQALRTLMERGIPACFLTYGGWFVGHAVGAGSSNIELRMAQHAMATKKATCTRLARGFVCSKILNCRTLLRRNASGVDRELLALRHLARKASQSASVETLLGIEGTAARIYFGAFTRMLKSRTGSLQFDLEGRNRRPPKDPVNALLSFAYSLLTKEFVLATRAAGLEPLLGFYHRPRFGRPALALDLMEEFRPLIADSVVINVLNNQVVAPGDFLSSMTGVALRPAARRRVIEAHERRMAEVITHPVFRYRISYRRVLEVQARLLCRLLLGEIDVYPPFRTR
ncbi:MAG: CRISPR-associated endonuclease Cas1 [Proteobacteria bacterium]|nr:CRISPR-associated endonuclease Cas1 [Pseudomonadota bacterium]